MLAFPGNALKIIYHSCGNCRQTWNVSVLHRNLHLANTTRNKGWCKISPQKKQISFCTIVCSPMTLNPVIAPKIGMNWCNFAPQEKCANSRTEFRTYSDVNMLSVLY